MPLIIRRRTVGVGRWLQEYQHLATCQYQVLHACLGVPRNNSDGAALCLERLSPPLLDALFQQQPNEEARSNCLVARVAPKGDGCKPSDKIM